MTAPQPPANDHGFQLRIDDAQPAEQSIALRYADALEPFGLSRRALAATSLREGARILPLGEWRGVALWVADESSRMATGTYKSLDGCVTTALCRSLGLDAMVFSSGANAGVALTRYGARAGLATYFFCPVSTLYKLDAELFDPPSAHLIAVEGHDRRVKQAAQAMADWLDLPVVPQLDWRLLAASLRGLFLAERLRDGEQFDWLSQSVCAGYGPLGIYRVMHDLVAGGTIDHSSVPRFLGVQQVGLSPIADAWQAGLDALPEPTDNSARPAPIEPTLYNMHPAATYPQLAATLRDTRGAMQAVTRGDFDRLIETYVAMLRDAGVEPTTFMRDGRMEYLERAGLMGGVGTLRAIEQGVIEPGQRVLCSLTGGAGAAPTSMAQPAHVITESRSLDDQINALRRHIAPRPLSASA